MMNDFPQPKLTSHPSLRLVNNTIANLDYFSDINVSDPSSLMTQWINSLAGILTMALDPLLDKDKLSGILIGDDDYNRLGFPDFRFIVNRSEHSCDFLNLEKLLRFLRNGLAHGNTEFVPGHWHRGSLNGVITTMLSTSLAGIAVWTEWSEKGKTEVSPALVLGFVDIACLVRGLADLCQEKRYWNETAVNWSGDIVLEKYGMLPARADLVIHLPSDKSSQ